jgi:hypothetical protein
VIRAVLAVAALAGCIDDHYACKQDSDCNLGEAGRCEADHLCTQYDTACPLARSYSDHSGALAGKCFVEPSTLVDPCAAGQPPITADSSYGGVCAKLPTCCTTGWIEACVQLAQLEYKPSCDTRLALTAWKNTAQAPMAIALYDLRYSGSTWQVMPTTSRGTFLDWIAPSPADPTGAPRLASTDASATNLLVGEDPVTQSFPLLAGRTFDTLTSVDFERSGRDTAMLSSNSIAEPVSDHVAHVLLDLGTGGQRSIVTSQVAPLETWGDFDGDPFPDAVAETNASPSYHFVVNTDDPSDHSRQLDDNSGTTGGGGNQPNIGAFEWTDLDGNGQLDLVEIGSQIAIHLSPPGGGPLSYIAGTKIDCDTPVVNMGCKGSQTAADVGFVGTAVAQTNGVVLVVGADSEQTDSETPPKATFRSLVLYVIAGAGTATPMVETPAMYNPCTGSGMAGSDCAVFRAVVARDLNHDGILDVVAIDNALTIYTFLGEANGMFGAVTKQALQGPSPPTYTFVRASLTGALSP